MILRLLAARRRDESGSMMIAVIVVGVIGLLVATTLDTVTGGLGLTRNDQNRVNAFQFANAGVDQAVYRIDRQDLPTGTVGTYKPTLDAEGNVVAFTERLEVGPSSYDIAVEQDPPGQTTRWKVRSLGTDKPTGRQRLAVATIAARPLFENGFFTVEDFYLRGLQTTPIAYDSGICPAAAPLTSPGCNYDPVPGGLGTNAKVIGAKATIVEFVKKWREFNMYGRATQAAAEGDCGLQSVSGDPSTAECAKQGGVVNPITDQLQYPLPPPPDGTQVCPSGGNIGTDGATTYIAPGDYTCENLTFRGDIVINPVGIARFWPTKSFVAAANAVINEARTTRNFQVYFPIQSGGSSSSICDAEIWGLLYTPGLEIDCNGKHQPEMYGAVVANLHAGTGNDFEFHWDLDALYAVNDGKYVVRNWRECPVGTPDC